MPPGRKPKNDVLPKVIICGITEENIPKLIVCDDIQQRDENRVCPGPCNVPDNMQMPIPRNQDPLTCGGCGPPFPQMQQNLEPAPNQLMCELRYKEQTIESLQKTLCSVQCEMDNLIKQNEILKEKILQTCSPSLQVKEKTSRGRGLDCLTNRMDSFNENTKKLEQQVCEMANNVKLMKQELLAVQAQKKVLEQNKKVCIPFPFGWCGPSPSPCNR